MPSDVCPLCDGSIIVWRVPEALRQLLEGNPSTAILCEECLFVDGAPDRSLEQDWDPSTTSGVLPADPDAALAMGLLVTYLDSLALHRSEIEVVVTYLEEAHGVDALLALDRITTTPRLDPPIDVRGRRDQLAQML